MVISGEESYRAIKGKEAELSIPLHILCFTESRGSGPGWSQFLD
jgi:hypothetical protein